MPETSAARVVAVVLNWNGFRDTVECVESLLRSQRVPDQIVVFDNGSIDGSCERLRRWADSRSIGYVSLGAGEREAWDAAGAGLVIVESDANLGYARANNLAMERAIEARAHYVWILNNDVVVDPAALGEMLALAEGDASIGMIGAKLLRYHEPQTIQALGGGYIIPVICHDTQLGAGLPAEDVGCDPIGVDHLIGASLLVRARAARDVGPIDESYFLYREETDWCIRMKRRGWRLYCCTRAVVWHKQARSIGFKSPLHDYYAVRNVLRLARKFYPRFVATTFAYFACRSLLPKIARLEVDRAKAVCLALRDFLSGVAGKAAHHSDDAFARHYLPGLEPPSYEEPERRPPVARVSPAIGPSRR